MKNNPFMPSKVTVYTPVLYPWVLDLRAALEKKGCIADAFTTGIFGNYPEWKIFEDQISVIPHIMILGDPVPSLSAYSEMFQGSPDLLVLSGTETTGSMLISILGKLKGIPVLFIVEENTDVRQFHSLFLRVMGGLKKIAISAIHRKADILLPETEASKKYLISIGCQCGNAKVAPHGIDVTVFKPRSPDTNFAKRIGIDQDDLDNKLKILYAGGFNKHKGIDVVVELLEKNMLKENMIMIIPSFGEHKKKYLKTLKNYNSVNLIPQLGYKDMIELYSVVDVVLVPSMTNGSTERSPNIVIEAMASGKTVIASDIGGIPDIVGDSGILVPQKDARSIGIQLRRLADDRALMIKYGQKARSRALKNLDADVYATTILNEYTEHMRSSADS